MRAGLVPAFSSCQPSETGRAPRAPRVIDRLPGLDAAARAPEAEGRGAVPPPELGRKRDERPRAAHGGLGVMADDAMAAVYGNVVMRLLVLVAPAGWLV